MGNIRKRGRDYEKHITAAYLRKIQESYFSFFRQNPESKYLIIDVNNIDFVENEEDYRKITETIFAGQWDKGLNMVIL
jgi:deoxyadenosine/deoxycytidine kinase